MFEKPSEEGDIRQVRFTWFLFFSSFLTEPANKKISQLHKGWSASERA